MKDDIYFYFNSKYARPEFEAPNGQPYSLVKDTNEGKIFNFKHVFKYIKVIDDALIAPGGTPKDNVKHLLGAVRLVRRGSTDLNPSLDFLNVFCLFYLKANAEGTPSGEDLDNSYMSGCRVLKTRVPYDEFYRLLALFKNELIERKIIGDSDLARLEKLELLIELQGHLDWTTKFSEKFTSPF